MLWGYPEPSVTRESGQAYSPVVSEAVTFSNPTGIHSPGCRLGEELARSRPRLLALAKRMTRDEDAAADVVQRACVKALVHADQYAGRAALRTWVWRITANEALLWLRERKRRARQRVALAACVPWREVAASPLEALEQRQRRDRVRRALDALAPRERALIELALAADRSSITRLSTQSGVGARTLRTRLYRARQRLRRLLEQGSEPDAASHGDDAPRCGR
jgi:RNA polymerase sigma-70 factor (ECF subfamily)